MKFEKYPFEKLSELLFNIEPNKNYSPITLTIGEPQFETPKFIQNRLKETTNLLNKYPKSAGEDILRDSMIKFVKNRFKISLDNTQIIPTLGTREVLFNFPQFLLFDKENPKMAYPNPFYQIYEGSAIASRAEVIHLNLDKENGFKPKIEKEKLKGVNLVILNSPNNPTGSCMSLEELCEWVNLSLEMGFVLINDECYSEIYMNTPPNSLLEASIKVGNSKFKNILVLNSISKRSSAPGLRSGFIAGDSEILFDYMRYRTYIGCAIPLPIQMASEIAWSDEEHVREIRAKYVRNFEIAKEILNIDILDTTFYIWLKVDDDLKFTKELYRDFNLKVLAGSFLGRDGAGANYVRIALVESEDKTREAMERLKSFLQSGNR